MNAFLGGLIIGLSGIILFFFLGRVMGVSGICSAVLEFKNIKKELWRIFFILGLIVGGFIINRFSPQSLSLMSLDKIYFVIAGLLVGYGTLLGNGCTSGHGICGISRFSIRSIAATITFIIFGVIGVLLTKYFVGTI